ncbi:MAG: SH3 domain-containing protein [Chloroflexi bacterium]|nr:SH3 domain-containing protein [Chloroflexota bacterium]
MRPSMRAAFAMFTLLLGWIPVPSVQASQPLQAGTGWNELAPGVQYQEFVLPGPVRAYVARMEITDSDPNDGIATTLETALGRGVLGGLETVRGMAARYDDAINFWGQTWGNRSDILVAVNGSYFGDSDTPENGMVQSGWYAKRFTDLGGGSGLVWTLNRQVFIDDCIYHQPAKQRIRIEDSQGSVRWEGPFTGTNVSRGNNDLVLYTPQFGTRTPTRSDGIEVVLQLNRPLLVIPSSAASVVGTVTAIRDRQGATLIPFDAIVLSAGENRRGALLDQLEIGFTVRINQEITSLSRNCATARSMPWTKAYSSLGAAFHLLEGGAAFVPAQDTTRAPRTAIAHDDYFIYLIVVDGRQPDFSIGMTFQELADFIRYNLAVQDAVAQDGGGSSTMVVNGNVVNRPSDICNFLFLPMVITTGNQTITKPIPALEENFEPPSRLQYGCERRVANAFMIASVSPREASSLFLPGDKVFTIQDALLRQGPGTNYPAFGVVAAGSFGEILEDGNGLNGIRAKGTNWWKVNFNGAVGWVAEGTIDALLPRFVIKTPY